MWRSVVIVAALCVACAVDAETLRTFSLGEETLIAVQDTPSTMARRLFPSLSDADFADLAGGPAAPSSVNVIVLRRGGRDVLVDAGNGGTRGAMLSVLRTAGIQPDAIKDILLTHMHGDHIGGLTDASGSAVFPNATLHVSLPERDHWLKQPGRNGIQARKVFAAYAGRVKTFAFGENPLPGVTALDASGHTPGHTAFETDALLIIGDLLHAAAIQIPRPEVSSTYDVDPAKAAATRLRLYERAAASGKPVAGMHLPYPGLGRIVKEASGFRYVPNP